MYHVGLLQSGQDFAYSMSVGDAESSGSQAYYLMPGDVNGSLPFTHDDVMLVIKTALQADERFDNVSITKTQETTSSV